MNINLLLSVLNLALLVYNICQKQKVEPRESRGPRGYRGPMGPRGKEGKCECKSKEFSVFDVNDDYPYN